MQKNPLSIVGSWRLIEFEWRKADGTKVYPFGRQAQGSFIYTEDGRYAAQLMRRDRPRFESGDQLTGTPEEIEASYKGCISYFGTYEVDHENGVIIHHVEASLFPNMEGRDQKRFFELSGNRLQLKTPPTKLGGEEAVGVLLWERIS